MVGLVVLERLHSSDCNWHWYLVHLDCMEHSIVVDMLVLESDRLVLGSDNLYDRIAERIF